MCLMTNDSGFLASIITRDIFFNRVSLIARLSENLSVLFLLHAVLNMT